MCWLSKYEPIGLDEVVGQSGPVMRLRRFRDNPFPACFLLEGPGGVGKTASAHAMAHDLGCRPFPEHAFSGLHVIRGEELSADLARDFFGNRGRSPLDLYPQTEWPREDAPGWHVVIIEELDWISPQAQKALKTNLDGRNLRPRCVVVATSNGAGRLDRALLQRFDIMQYSGGDCFAADCNNRLSTIWTDETGQPSPPSGFDQWGWIPDPDMMNAKSFSMRVALRRAETFAELQGAH